MTREEGRFVASSTIDACAVVSERIADEDYRCLLGVQVTLIVKTKTGIRVVNTLKERR
jgi:predicted RNase H-like nuclease